MQARSLSLSQVNKIYGHTVQVHAAQDINLDVRAGEFMSFLGPSGSGKTTTLMMIAGFQTPSSGSIRLGDAAIDRLPPHRRNIGMVFQNYALFPHLSIAENVAFPLKMRRVARAEREARARAALEKVNLGAQTDRLPGQLSGGQQQRVALARALVFEPDIILLDEPLGALDKALREQMQVELKRMHRELGVTMIYVTHDQTEAMTMSDRIAVFNHGRIEQCGTPAEIYFAPETRFVAGFIGDSNLIDATSRGGGLFDTALGPVRAARTDVAPGVAATLLLRPEMITASATAGADTIPMQIETEMNYGDSLLLIGRAGQQPLRIRVPGTDVQAMQGAQTVHAGWSADHVHVVL